MGQFWNKNGLRLDRSCILVKSSSSRLGFDQLGYTSNIAKGNT